MAALYEIFIKCSDLETSEDVTDFLATFGAGVSWESGPDKGNLRAFEFPNLESAQVENKRDDDSEYDFVVAENVELYRDNQDTRDAVMFLASAIADHYEVSTVYEGQNIGRNEGVGPIVWANPLPPFTRDEVLASNPSAQVARHLKLEHPRATRFHSDQPSARSRMEAGLPITAVTYRILIDTYGLSFESVAQLIFSTLDGMILEETENSAFLLIDELPAHYSEDIPPDLTGYFRRSNARLDIHVPERWDSRVTSDVVRQIARNLATCFDITVLYDHEWIIGSFHDYPDSVRFHNYDLVTDLEDEGPDGEATEESELDDDSIAPAFPLHLFRPVPGTVLPDWVYEVDDRRARINLVELIFENAKFRDWIFSLMPNPAERALVQDVSFINCQFGEDVRIGGACFIDCTFENLQGSFRTNAAVFSGTILRGEFDDVRISATPSYSDPHLRRAWVRANQTFYRTASIAVDPREAKFRQCPDFSGVPSHLIAWENTPSVSVHYQQLTQEKIDAIDFGVTPWKASLERLLKDERDEILFAPMLHEDAGSFLNVLETLVAKQLATAAPKS